MEAAVESYVDSVLRHAPNEREMLPVETGEMPAISLPEEVAGQETSDR
jgi:hypothetical protein